jgi:DNA transposition AAA+ family ATPase
MAPSTFSPPVRHHADPPGVGIIETEGLLISEHALRYVIGHRQLGALTGVAGTGKTFALEVLLRDRSDVHVVWIEVQVKPTMLSIARALALALLGEVPRGSRHELSYHLQDALVDQAGETPLVVVFDEAQRLNNECAEYLRYLHDPHDTRFAMVLAGGNGCWETIRREPMLHSRVHEPVFFKALGDRALLQMLPNYHAMYEQADPGLLLWIDQQRCQGILRHWSAFTASAAQLLQQRKEHTLTRAVADVVLQQPE